MQGTPALPRAVLHCHGALPGAPGSLWGQPRAGLSPSHFKSVLGTGGDSGRGSHATGSCWLSSWCTPDVLGLQPSAHPTVGGAMCPTGMEMALGLAGCSRVLVPVCGTRLWQPRAAMPECPRPCWASKGSVVEKARTSCCRKWQPVSSPSASCRLLGSRAVPGSCSRAVTEVTSARCRHCSRGHHIPATAGGNAGAGGKL